MKRYFKYCPVTLDVVEFLAHKIVLSDNVKKLASGGGGDE